MRRVGAAGLIVLSVAVSGAGQPPQYVMSTYAGGGPPPTPAPGLHMWFDFAQGVAADRAGNVYFSALHCVFRLDSTSGIVTRVAGNGHAGYSGDGGQAAAAELYQPIGLAVDGLGNLFIADSLNARIRRVSPDGTITTVAGNGTFGSSGDGGPAISAQLGMSWPQPGRPPEPPRYVAVDGAGDLFIGDYQRVRKVTADGTINTVVENISGPLAADSAGNLFVATNLVTRIAPDGTVTTVAGGQPVSGNTLGWTGVTSAACVDDLSGDNGAALQTGLCGLQGIAVDAAGNLFLGENFYDDPAADNWAFAVRKVSSNGIITTVAGNTRGYALDGGPATAGLIDWGGAATVDRAGNLFLLDFADVRRVSPDGIIDTVAGSCVCTGGDPLWAASQHFYGDGGPATSAILNNPTMVAVDGAGSLYINDEWNRRVRKVTPDGTITTVAGGGTLAGSAADGGPATSAALLPDNDSRPFTGGLAVDGAGNLFLADGHTVRRVSADGIITTVAGGGTVAGSAAEGGLATSAQLAGVGGLAADFAGNLYIAEFDGHRVRQVTPDGLIFTFAGTGSEGNTGDSGFAFQAQLAYPFAVAVDSAGDVYIAVGFGQYIREVTPDGRIQTIAGNSKPANLGDGGPAISAALYMDGIAVDGMGDVFIADAARPAIREITADGIINTIAGGGPCCAGYVGYTPDGTFSLTSGVAVDATGNVYVADTYNNVVRILRPVQ